MQIRILTKNLNLSESQEDLIRRKVEALVHLASRLSDESSELKVHVEYEESRRSEDAYYCQLTAFVPQNTLRAESRNGTLENAVDEVIGKLKTQIEHYKAKTARH